MLNKMQFGLVIVYFDLSFIYLLTQETALGQTQLQTVNTTPTLLTEYRIQKFL